MCASCFIGLKNDFGNGPRLFIDNREDIISEFKDYFEDEKIKKSWRNYSFSRHILFNHGIDAKGLQADIMHMAKLADPSKEAYNMKDLMKDMKYKIEWHK